MVRNLKTLIRLMLICFGLIFSTPNFAKFIEKSIKVHNGEIKYYQIGKGKPIVLVHGLFANKEQWLPFVARLIKKDPQLTEKIQLIIPDLPGYGKSQGYPIQIYNLDKGTDKQSKSTNQIEVLHAFISQLQLDKPISLAGNSMGGLISALYAIHYPTEVNSLAFIGSPLGVAEFTPRFINTGFRQGYNPFIPLTVDEFHNELALLFRNKNLTLPSDEQIKAVILPYIAAHFKTMTATFNMVSVPYNTNYFRHPVPLKQPVLVLWGDEDYVFGSVKHAKELCSHLTQAKSCVWHPIAHAGHVLMLENPQVLDTSVGYYLEFLRANQVLE